MSIRIAINGFGRIGRSVLRLAFEKFETIQVVAINDLVPCSTLAYLLKYDSIHGRFPFAIESSSDHLVINQKNSIQVLAEKDPKQLPWQDLKIDYVIESTGRFTARESAELHLQAGAKRVVISAPAKRDIPTYVVGVNHEKYCPQTDVIVSNASCTTNCLAPIAKILLDNFGIEEGLMTTVHALTATQPVHDSPSKKHLRDGRSALANIIPASTGAAKAVSLCLPELAGKLTGMAFRVPVANVSVVDLTVKLRKPTSYGALCAKVDAEAQSNLKGIVGFTRDDVVSSDFIGDTHSSIFDASAGMALNENFFKLIAWYDNEMGYSCRLLDLICHMANQE